jgi:ABC-type molybdenum transport system ATPase subunit/photorepair protein PhrA
MELVVDPLVLVLDEPTSGLDSTSGLRVVEALQKAAHVKGLTVVTVSCVIIYVHPSPLHPLPHHLPLLSRYFQATSRA